MRKGDLRVLARQFKCSCAGGGENLHEELRIVSFVNIYPSVVKMTSRLFVVHKFSSRVAYKDWVADSCRRLLQDHINNKVRANGLRYPLVGGTRQRRFAGTHSKPHKTLENAQTPTSRVHAVLGCDCGLRN